MAAWYGLVMQSEARGFSTLRPRACWSVLCSEHVGVLVAAGQAAQLRRAVQGSQLQKDVPVCSWGYSPDGTEPSCSRGWCSPGAGEVQEPGVCSAHARPLPAGYLLAEKVQNFICSCQVKTERMINGDQIRGKISPKILTASGDILSYFFCWICRLSALL